MKLYHFKVSPPSRCALMTAKNLDLDIEVKIVDFPGREHFSEEFLKINPLHTIPVLVDGDLILTESRAIACYLCNLKPGCSLYPSDPKARALVDLRLYYDATVVYPSWYNNAVVSKSSFHCFIIVFEIIYFLECLDLQRSYNNFTRCS